MLINQQFWRVSQRCWALLSKKFHDLEYKLPLSLFLCQWSVEVGGQFHSKLGSVTDITDCQDDFLCFHISWTIWPHWWVAVETWDIILSAVNRFVKCSVAKSDNVIVWNDPIVLGSTWQRSDGFVGSFKDAISMLIRKQSQFKQIFT